MRSPLLWLSAADDELLRKCAYLQSSEKIRYKALGALVLIPATLALCSMAYAISTVAPDPRVFVTGGLIWATIVVTIDRYLLATTFKTSVGKKSGWASIIARYVFAIFVGVAVAHPFVLLWFNDSIVQQISGERRVAIAERTHQGDAARATLGDPSRDPQLTTLLQTRTDENNQLACLVELQQYEQSSAPPKQLPCGATTGIRGCAQKCQDLSPTIEAQKHQIDLTSQQIETAQQANSNAAAERQKQLDAINAAQQKDISDIERNFSTDYLARVNALSAIAAQHQEVTYVAVFIVVLFVFVDVLPITMKFVTRPGEYEAIRDTQILRQIATQKAESELIGDGKSERAIAEAGATATRFLGEVSIISSVSTDLVETYTRKRLDFEESLRAARHGLDVDPDSRAAYLAYGNELRGVDDAAWRAIFSKVRAYLARI